MDDTRIEIISPVIKSLARKGSRSMAKIDTLSDSEHPLNETNLSRIKNITRDDFDTTLRTPLKIGDRIIVDESKSLHQS